jgi:hypothetical protein
VVILLGKHNDKIRLSVRILLKPLRDPADGLLTIIDLRLPVVLERLFNLGEDVDVERRTTERCVDLRNQGLADDLGTM